MDPILFTLPDWLPLSGGSPIYAYGLLLGLSVLVGWALAHPRLVGAGLSEGWAIVAVGCAVVFGLLGARAMHLVFHPEDWAGFRSLLRFDAAGAMFWGALLAGGTVLTLLARVRSAQVGRALDGLAAAIAIGVVLTSMGIFLHGDNYGAESESALAVRYGIWEADVALAVGQPGPAPVLADLEHAAEPVFGHVFDQAEQMRAIAASTAGQGSETFGRAPAAFHAKIQTLATLVGAHSAPARLASPLLAAGVGMLALLSIVWWRRRPRFDGQAFLGVVLTLTFGLFAVDLTRGDLAPALFGPFAATQVVAAGLFGATLVFWWWCGRRATSTDARGDTPAVADGS